ncbi:MAG: ABC-F family ATP-binding cassette domain-containing protein [Chitinophagales bacterium]|nr:ABC-F family ATP-binding cassette domain-containing protein [Chitinophagales bacterium]
MNYLFAENISRSFADKKLFSGLTISINKGQKIGLIAKNGLGKTSLLRILTGEEKPETGSVLLRKNLRLGFLEQEPALREDQTVLENIFDTDHPVINAVKLYEFCLDNNSQGPEMQHALELMDEHDAWNFEAKAKEILSRLDIHAYSSLVKTLSGGQRKRVALARLLLHEPEFLILDEPTNHLDLTMIEWLEHFLDKNCNTLLMVTHDRDFLDNVCKEIIELDDGKIYYYEGSYQYYVEKKAERKENESQNIDKARNTLRKELEWMRKQPKARTTKSKSRIDSFYELKERASKKIDESEMKAEIKITRLGGKVLEFHHVHKGFDDLRILSDFSYKFKTGERIGVIGKNGVGKTTFLNLCLLLEKPDSGKIVVGETVLFGYFSQKGMVIDEQKRVIEVVREVADYITLNKGKTLTASQLLERFLFNPDQQYVYVSKLSGGEKRRLYLLTILMKNPNFLILDEPTNDLDIITQNVLEDFLDDFPGCLLIVSHDRHFMKKITDHLLVFEGKGLVIDFPGNYSEYLEWKALDEQSDAASEEIKKIDSTISPGKLHVKIKLSYKEQREIEQLELDIAALEKRKKELTGFLETALPYEQLQKYSSEINNLIDSLDKKSNRWLELSEYA